MISKALDRQLAELKTSIAGLQPPAEVDAAISSAIASKRSSSRGRIATPAHIAWFAALAASVAFIAIFRPEQTAAPLPVWDAGTRSTSNTETPLPVWDAGTRSTSNTESAPFLPVVPMEELAQTGDALVVPARLSRMTLAQFGLPVNPAEATDAVDTELLIRGDGAVLALRLVN